MRLLPHDASFFAHFEHQGKKTVEGCRAFLEMVEQSTNLEARADRVKQIEHECDEITHAVVAGLHKTFITPIDRNDIYTLITKMDDIMARTRATTGSSIERTRSASWARSRDVGGSEHGQVSASRITPSFNEAV